MSQPIPLETIEYERYANGVRIANTHLLDAAQFAIDTFEHSGCKKKVCPVCKLEAAVALAGGVPSLANARTITIQVKGGLVQEVSGIPGGYELRIEDYDVQDPGDESWDPEKECVVTLYEGAAA